MKLAVEAVNPVNFDSDSGFSKDDDRSAEEESEHLSRGSDSVHDLLKDSIVQKAKPSVEMVDTLTSTAGEQLSHLRSA